MYEAYAAVERSYSQGRYEEALSQATGLLASLSTAADEPFRPRLQLLVGHCHLYGLANPSLAAAAYQEVLDGCDEPVLREIATEGLAQCTATTPAAVRGGTPESAPSVGSTGAASTGVASASAAATSSQPQSSAAMPWLEKLGGETPIPAQPAAAMAPFQMPITAAASAPGEPPFGGAASEPDRREAVPNSRPQAPVTPEPPVTVEAPPPQAAAPAVQPETEPEPELIIPEVIAPPEEVPPPLRSGGFSREEEEELARGLLIVEL